MNLNELKNIVDVSFFKCQKIIKNNSYKKDMKNIIQSKINKEIDTCKEKINNSLDNCKFNDKELKETKYNVMKYFFEKTLEVKEQFILKIEE